eukprot:gene16511-25316_t
MAIDAQCDAMLRRFGMKYGKHMREDRTERGAEECLAWLEDFVTESLRCLHSVVGGSGMSSGHDVMRAQLGAVAVLKELKAIVASMDDEVSLRVQELQAVGHWRDEERRKKSSWTDAAEKESEDLARRAHAGERQVAALEAALHAANRELAEQSSALTCATTHIDALTQRVHTLEATETPSEVSSTPPAADIEMPAVEQSCSHCREVKDALTEAENQRNAALAKAEQCVKLADAAKTKQESDRKELDDIIARFGIVDVVVEKVKKDLPARVLPKAFHRCGPDVSRWVFGTRRISIHPAGARGAVACVGGGFLPLRDFVLRSGELERAREARCFSEP